MIGPVLVTADGRIRLIEPNIERDAPLSMRWQNGPVGHETMALMGNAPDAITDVDLDSSRALTQQFLTQTNEINWMVECGGEIIGSVWIHLEDNDYIKAPALSFMIGDPEQRGKGITKLASNLVIEWAYKNQMPTLYMRALTHNSASNRLIVKLGAKPYGQVYRDNDQLEWQNYSLTSTPFQNAT